MLKARICPKCGAKVREKDRSCSLCGFPLINEAHIPSFQRKEQRKQRQRGPAPPVAPSPAASPPPQVSKCPRCGKEMASSTPYCPFCGLPLEARTRPAPVVAFQEPILGEMDIIFEEPVEVEKETEKGEAAVTQQELLDYLKTMKGLVHLLHESPQYGELLKEAIAGTTESIFVRAYGRERLTSKDEAVGYAIKVLERTCQRYNIPLPPEWHEKSTQAE